MKTTVTIVRVYDEDHDEVWFDATSEDTDGTYLVDQIEVLGILAKTAAMIHDQG